MSKSIKLEMVGHMGTMGNLVLIIIFFVSLFYLLKEWLLIIQCRDIVQRKSIENWIGLSNC